MLTRIFDESVLTIPQLCVRKLSSTLSSACNKIQNCLRSPYHSSLEIVFIYFFIFFIHVFSWPCVKQVSPSTKSIRPFSKAPEWKGSLKFWKRMGNQEKKLVPNETSKNLLHSFDQKIKRKFICLNKIDCPKNNIIDF